MEMRMTADKNGVWDADGVELIATTYGSNRVGAPDGHGFAAELARRWNAHAALLVACEALIRTGEFRSKASHRAVDYATKAIVAAKKELATRTG